MLGSFLNINPKHTKRAGGNRSLSRRLLGMVIKKRLGYADFNTTINTYVHVLKSADESAAIFWDNIISGTIGTPNEKFKRSELLKTLI